jgi:DNA gyrase subunit B
MAPWGGVDLCIGTNPLSYAFPTRDIPIVVDMATTSFARGKVFIAESPLYEIRCKDQTYFAYDDPEKERITKRLAAQKFTLQRSKGLGENEPDMMNLTTMNPKTRRLIKVMPADAKKTDEVFNLLLGDNLSGRKKHIAAHGAEYMQNADVS